jgi:hypothetical protein
MRDDRRPDVAVARDRDARGEPGAIVRGNFGAQVFAAEDRYVTLSAIAGGVVTKERGRWPRDFR